MSINSSVAEVAWAAAVEAWLSHTEHNPPFLPPKLVGRYIAWLSSASAAACGLQLH